MIKELFYELYNGYRQVVGKGAVIVLFIASLPALFRLYGDKDRGWAGALLSPLSVIGCAASGLVGKILSVKEDGRAKRLFSFALVLCLCILAVTVSGSNIIYENITHYAENDMHIPQDMILSMDAVLSDSDDPKVLTMPGWGLYFESYSSAFDMMYEEPANGDSALLDEDERTVYIQLSDVHPDMKKITSIAHRYGCGYIVLSNGIWPDVPVTSCGYELLYGTDSCSVYREVRTP